MGLGLLYGGLRLAAGDEVLTTEHDFYATHESLRLRTERDGVAVRRVTLYADPATATADEIVSNLVAAVGPRTKVVAVTWVHSSTGVRLPIRAMADALRAKNSDDAAVRRRRARVRRGRRDARSARLRLPRLRLPQVAARPARHRPGVGQRARLGAVRADDPAVRRARASASGWASARTRRRPARPRRRAATTASSTGGRSPRRSTCTTASAGTGSPPAPASWPPGSRTASPGSAGSRSSPRATPTCPPAWSAASCPVSTPAQAVTRLAAGQGGRERHARTAPPTCGSAPPSPTDEEHVDAALRAVRTLV